MYNTFKDLTGFTLTARDGQIGRVKDLFFDDVHWAIRHLVADTGNWLPKRRVLISPIAILGVLEAEKTIHVDLTREQIEKSPTVEHDQPVSRQMEEQQYRYYNWPYYWSGPDVWGLNPFPRAYVPPPGAEQSRIPRKRRGDPHLRSAHEVAGYRIQALDDQFGHVDDFIFDNEDWVIRYVVVDTRNWWPGKKVVLSPDWLSSIDWNQACIHVGLDRETVKRSPEYQPDKRITREYEKQLHTFYNREPYWREHVEALHAH